MTHEELLQTMIYNPETGRFFWLRPSSSKLKPGDMAGTQHGNGYRRVEVLGQRVFEHRLAWFYVTGTWPEEIDHINGIRDDNRIENLREVTRSQNNLNLRGRAKSNNSTGVLGVSRSAAGTFFARIKRNGMTTHLGSFATASEAGEAYKAAALAQKG